MAATPHPDAIPSRRGPSALAAITAAVVVSCVVGAALALGTTNEPRSAASQRRAATSPPNTVSVETDGEHVSGMVVSADGVTAAILTHRPRPGEPILVATGMKIRSARLLRYHEASGLAILDVTADGSNWALAPVDCRTRLTGASTPGPDATTVDSLALVRQGVDPLANAGLIVEDGRVRGLLTRWDDDPTDPWGWAVCPEAVAALADSGG